MAATGQLVFPTYSERTNDYLFSTFTLNETTDWIAQEFCAPESQTITQLGINVSSVSGSPTIELSLQGVTNGVPDGTIKSGGSAKVTWTAASGWVWKTLDSSYSASAGEFLCWVAKITGGTSAVINCRVAGIAGFPTTITNDNATLTTTRTTTSSPVWGAKGSGTTWCWGQPISATGQTSVNSTNVVESGLLLTMPSWFTSAQVIGAKVHARLQSTSTNVEFGLYAGGNVGDTTRSTSVTLTGYDPQTINSGVPIIVYFPSPLTVNGGDSFRISVRATTTSNYIEYYHSVSAVEDLLGWTQFWGYGNVQSTRRTTGNWTNDNKTMRFIAPIIGDITVPSGGSGGIIVHPGMVGGMRG